MPKILVVEKLDEQELERFKRDGFEIDYQPKMEQMAITKALESGVYDSVVVGSHTINKQTIEAWSLKKPSGKLAIIRAGSNVGAIDLNAASAHGIVVMNTPGANSQYVARTLLSFLDRITDAGQISTAHDDLASGQTKSRGHYREKKASLEGKKIALIGCGYVGTKVARLAKAYGMTIVAYPATKPGDPEDTTGIKRVSSLNEALKDADFVSVQVPITEQGTTERPATKGMIGEDQIKLLKDRAIIVSASKSEVFDMNAVTKALKAKKLKGFALDSTEKDCSSILASYEYLNTRKTPEMKDRVIITPSTATAYTECLRNVSKEALKRLTLYFKESIVLSATNPEFSKHSRSGKITIRENKRNLSFSSESSGNSRKSDKSNRNSSLEREDSKLNLPERINLAFSRKNIKVKSDISVELGDTEIARIFLTYEKEATHENYAYSGMRVLNAGIPDGDAIENAIRLSHTSSSWKNWLINKAIKDGALVGLENSQNLPKAIKQLIAKKERKIYGGRIIIVPTEGEYKDTGLTFEQILNNPDSPYFKELSTPIYEKLRKQLNDLGGKVKATPDFGPNASTADIAYGKGEVKAVNDYKKGTEHILGISPDKGGSGGKSEYSIVSILQSLETMGLKGKPKDTPITLIGSAGALGSGVSRFLEDNNFTNVVICDLQYDAEKNRKSPNPLPKGWKVVKSENGKFPDNALKHGGEKGGWIITTAYGDEMQNSNWKKCIQPGSTWIGAQNRDLPAGREGIKFARELKEHGVTHIPGQVLTIGGTCASWVEWHARQQDKANDTTKQSFTFNKDAAKDVVRAVTDHLVTQITISKEHENDTPFEAMLSYMDKEHLIPKKKDKAPSPRIGAASAGRVKEKGTEKTGDETGGVKI